MCLLISSNPDTNISLDCECFSADSSGTDFSLWWQILSLKSQTFCSLVMARTLLFAYRLVPASRNPVKSKHTCSSCMLRNQALLQASCEVRGRGEGSVCTMTMPQRNGSNTGSFFGKGFAFPFSQMTHYLNQSFCAVTAQAKCYKFSPNS